jgi:cytoskeleton protein RodZ
VPYDLKRNPRPETQNAEAARVGEELRESRQALGVSLEEMAEQLRINRRYLSALEEGRVRDLPGVAYATGFVRSYSQMLGLDPTEMVRRFREGAGIAARPKDLVFPEPVPDRGVPAGAIVILGAVLAIAGYAGWYYWSGSSSRVAEDVPALPPRLEQSAREAGLPPLPAVTTPETPPTAATPAGAAPPPAAAPNGALPARPNTASPTSPAVPATIPPLAGLGRPAQPATPPGAAAPPATPASPAPPPLAPAATAPAAPAANRIVLVASQETWVQVRDPRNNRVVFNRTLRPRETFEVPEGGGLLLTTGKAEGLAVEIDGVASPVLTGLVGVRRDIPLDAARLRDAAPGQIPPR